MNQVETVQAALPDSVYYVLGALIIMNLGVIVTVIGAVFKVVYNYAVLTTTVKALHKRTDRLEGKRYSSDEDSDI